MFVLRYCRTNMCRDNFYRIFRYTIKFGPTSGHLSDSSNLLKANTRFDKFKCHSYSSFATFQCWNCQTIVDTTPCLFCKNCSLIQSSEQQNFNYFELFNIYDQYDIDTGQLTSKFRELQSLVHPDKFSNKTEVNFILPL